MYEFARHLGDSVRRAREKAGLTQRVLAERLDKDQRTILNIENYHGNPKMEVLYPLIRTLRIDPAEIFYPELQDNSPIKKRLMLEVANCSESEATVLLSVCQTVLTALRNQNGISIEEDPE